MLIDSHCHLHDKEFFSAEEAERYIVRAREAGVEKIVCIGTDPEDSLAAADFASKHENVYWTYGIHPEEASKRATVEHIFSTSGLGSQRTSYTGAPREPSLLASLVRVPRGGRDEPLGHVRNIRSQSSKSGDDVEKIRSTARLVAIGEVGLDYHYEGYDREAQIKLFEQMLQLAINNNLPVSFHIREAFADFFPVVANFPTVRGVVHSFTDSKKVLKRILNETDFYIGVNGLATYSTLPTPPLERILLETDAPFLAPVPHRGETNEPAYIADIAKWLAEKLEVSIEEVARVTTDNSTTLYELD